MKRIILILLFLSICLAPLTFSKEFNYHSISNQYSDIILTDDTLQIEPLNLPLDSVDSELLKSKEKGKKHELKGRLKLIKRKSIKSREFGGVYIDESLMYRTR